MSSTSNSKSVDLVNTLPGYDATSKDNNLTAQTHNDLSGFTITGILTPLIRLRHRGRLDSSTTEVLSQMTSTLLINIDSEPFV